MSASYGINLNLVQIILQITKSVRLKITEKYSILVILKCVSKRSSEIISRKICIISSNRILKVANICTASMPTHLLLFCFFLTIYGYFHTIIEHRVIFVVIHNVKLNVMGFSSVLNSEIEPLSMTLRINIILH